MFVELGMTIGGMMIGIPVLFSLILRFLVTGFKMFQIKPRSTVPKALMDKTLGQHKFVSVNGVQLHYVESGDENKPLILFVHGFPEFWFSWRHQIKYFNKNYHVVAFDMRGYGESSKPEGISNYQLEHLVEDIKALVTELGYKRFHLVAHDWGGGVAWAFTGLHPDMVQTYTACNIPHNLALVDQLRGSWEQTFKSWYMLFFQCPVIPELNFLSSDMTFFYGLLRDAGLHKDEELVEAYKFAFNDFKTWNRTINYYRASARPGSQARKNIYRQMKNIEVPVLQIFGTGDKYLSVGAAQASAKFCTNLTTELLPGVSHWVQQQEPERVNSLINQFITKHS
ncbi:epoxide hydrolase 1 [Eurytemora carolleeae]|uniref:epoxide hydrolase 1 n=1 Tax=Eurytemora carolleeae TaxID=1294199 RepID=UPI000C75A4BA|nr:epoxide hydrolase 1 [Eurytemora carolleeae]|eukprot:XP_023321986.1 epoxide hydrolase 1-like [Eurytemora affinis]